MAKYAALAHTVYLDGYELTTDLGSMGLSIARDPLENTTFSPTRVARSRIAGLEDVQANGSGPWQAGAGAVDPQLFGNLGVLKVITMTPAAVEAERAYFFRATDYMYRPFGNSVGELGTFEWSAQAAKGGGTLSSGAIAGYLGKARGDVSATGALGTHKQLGAVSATQHLYGVVHLFGTPGTTVTVVLESDDSAAFSSATTRITFGPLTTAGATFSRVAGAISPVGCTPRPGRRLGAGVSASPATRRTGTSASLSMSCGRAAVAMGSPSMCGATQWSVRSECGTKTMVS